MVSRSSIIIIILLEDLFFLLIFTTTNFETSYCKTTKDHEKTLLIKCPEIEKQALVSFKQSLEDPEDMLSSWNDDEVDCCKWKGVVCNNMTGHVHELHLRGRYELPLYEPPFETHGLRGKINSSLLNLKYLNYLDLSLNDFGETIPLFIGSFANMEYLNLFEAGFYGAIPHTIGNLSNLRTLNLKSNELRIYSDNLDWLTRLSKLELLDMEFVDLSKASNWLHAINTFPSLSELRLRGCNLDWSTSIDPVNNLSSLHTLDMSYNYFNSSSIEFPRWTLQLKELTFLDLTDNFIEGPIPSVSNTTKLEYLSLSQNLLNSTIPDWLYACNGLEAVYLLENLLVGTISNDISNLSSLVHLDLTANNFYGNIPPGVWRSCKVRRLALSANKLQGKMSVFFGNMSDCFMGSLEELELGRNQISGHISNRFGNLKNLKFLELADNSISGGIPDVFGGLLNLEFLVLQSNNFVGNLPASLGKLLNLIYIDVSDNFLEGIVTEVHLMDLKNMSVFDAAGNRLNFKVSPNWVPPFQLSRLHLAYTALNGPFPAWLEGQKNMDVLDLSNSGIHGPIPSWVWNIFNVDLSNNNLYGSLPNNILSTLADFSSNRFSGSLPRIGTNVLFLDLSNNSISGGISNIICDQNTTEPYALEFLYLRGNQLSGELPDCWMRLKNLSALNLGDNDMHGSIPSSITLLKRLQILILCNNRLSGPIPPLLLSSRELVMVDLSDNYFHGNLPKWENLDSEPSVMQGLSTPIPFGLAGNKKQGLSSLGYIILRSNQLSGEIDSSICTFTSIQILDISNNNLHGTIPSCFSNFTAMVQNADIIARSSNSSQRRPLMGQLRGSFVVDIVTKGQQRAYGVLLPLVVSIDLSNNNLSGNLPLDFTRLVSLRLLNLSRNHLTGSIPGNIGDMKQLESLDLSLNSLTGEIPSSFTTMSSLNYLNLSYNNLTGRIPESTQIQSMAASSFVGNNLCGPPLTASKCGARDHDDGGGGDVSHEEVEVDWFIVLLSLGFAVGLSSFLVVMTFGKSLRDDYFEMLDDIFEKIYNAVA